MIVVPFLNRLLDIRNASPGSAKGVHGLDVRGEDLVQEVEVLGVEGEAVGGDGVADGFVVERVVEGRHGRIYCSALSICHLKWF